MRANNILMRHVKPAARRLGLGFVNLCALLIDATPFVGQQIVFELAQCVSNGFVTSTPCAVAESLSDGAQAIEKDWWWRGDSNARPRDYESFFA